MPQEAYLRNGKRDDLNETYTHYINGTLPVES
ncbi:MAG: hypothetical protein ACI8QH_001574, partial [Flammeovirgaceae bacterium]